MKKSVKEEFGNPAYHFEPEEVYSDKNFNQLCQDFDRLNEKYLALKKACDVAEPVAWKDTCVTTDENDVVSREPVLLGYEGWEMLTDGAGLFIHPAPVIASEQKPISEIQWRNIKSVVRQLADWAFGSQDDPKYGACWLAMVTGLTCKDGPDFNLEPLFTHPAPVIASEQKPVAYQRKWDADDEKPVKEKNANGRMQWPVRFRFLPVSKAKVLPDDIPLFTSPPTTAEIEQRVGEDIAKWIETQRNDIPATGIEFASAIRREYL